MYNMAHYDEPLLNELGSMTRSSDNAAQFLSEHIRRSELNIPELDERMVVKHFTHLSQMNYGVDTGIYPLGSCTMKYNFKLLERIAGDNHYTHLHPFQHQSTVQGTLEILFKLQEALCSITGMDAFSLQPMAGAHGEFAGMLIARAYHNSKREERNEVIIPDSAHGTNPASARMAGYAVVEIPSKDGRVDIEALEAVLSRRTAAFMLTNPNTLGIFETDILNISNMVRQVGALLYYDGANLNAIMGKARPGDMGFDIVHLNPHKTFGTPHGGGGPGAGPVGVKTYLEPFLPIPRVVNRNGQYNLEYDQPQSIGAIAAFYGNIPVLLKAYAYILLKGANGLQKVTEEAVLNANYLLNKLSDIYQLPYGGKRMHEFVVSAKRLKDKGIRAVDIAKRLLDYGVHPPTMYFPLIVEEALMVEPTESETKESLDAYAHILNTVAGENPEVVTTAPHQTPIGRIDQVEAVRNPRLTWKDLK